MRGLAPAPAPPFSYHRPDTLDEALASMRQDGAAALAGGTDVVPLRASGAIAPAHLVDVKRLPELRGVEAADGRLAIGAATTCAELARLEDPAIGALADGAGLVGAPQTRARATVGGNVCRSSPAGDTLCGLLVLDAALELRSPRASRRLALSEFVTGPGRNVREPDELLVAIDVRGDAGGSAYGRFTYRRSMDLAVVGVGCRVELDGGRCRSAAVAIGAVAPTPLLVPDAAEALHGSAGEDEAVEAALDAVVAAARPIDDVRGTERHRLKVLRPLAREVILRALCRARVASVPSGA